MSKYKSSKEHFEELLLFYKEHHRQPSYKSEDKIEKRLYSWIQSMKMAKRGKGTARYPDWLDEEAGNHGISNWFLVLDKAKEQFKRLIAFYLKYKRKPKRYNAVSPEEKKLAHWVYHMRQQRFKQQEAYPDWMDEEASKHGISEWFSRQEARQDENEKEEGTQE
jgi:hypothetical protein